MTETDEREYRVSLKRGSYQTRLRGQKMKLKPGMKLKLTPEEATRLQGIVEPVTVKQTRRK